MKKITTINFDIPGHQDNNEFFHSKLSLDDSDIVVIRTFQYLNETIISHNGITKYKDHGSKIIREDTRHWEEEIFSFLKSGKNVFVITTEVYNFYLSKLDDWTRQGVEEWDNYKFLSKTGIKLTNANGSTFNIVDNSFSEFVKSFNSILSFNCYLKGGNLTPLLNTKNGREKVSAFLPVNGGNLIFLPKIDFEELLEEEYWTKEAISFGTKFISFLIEIDKKLLANNDKSIRPSWLEDQKYQLKIENEISKKIESNIKKIEKLTSEISDFKEIIEKETIIKDLIFETGKPLERAVIKALEILGYVAENYDDGKLELDAIIVSPEGQRFIGECEGKDSKDIDISKFRQLNDSLAEDFEREEISEKAHGILFGNSQRLLDIGDRTLDFTKKCKDGAKREKIALIKTSDLFFVTKYLLENENEDYKKSCREAVFNQMGGVVVFPEIPQ